MQPTIMMELVADEVMKQTAVERLSKRIDEIVGLLDAYRTGAIGPYDSEHVYDLQLERARLLDTARVQTRKFGFGSGF